MFIGVVETLMSLFGLQTAMITAFSPDDEAFRLRMNTVTGTAVCAVVLIAAAVMLIHAHRTLRSLAAKQEDRA